MADFTTDESEKLQEKNSFLIQKSLIVDVKEMGVEETNLFFNSILDYVVTGTEPTLEGIKFRFVRASFNRFKETYLSDSKKWLKTCKKNKDNATARWERAQPTKDKNGNPTAHPKYK